MTDPNTILIVTGFIVQFLAILRFFNRIESRITALEIHIFHLMRKHGMKPRLSISENDHDLHG